MALCGLTDVKLHLSISNSDTSQDARLTAWLVAAIASIKNYCQGVDFESITRTDYYQPDGYNLVTNFGPISSVTSIYEDPNANWGDESGAFASSTLLTIGDDYALVKDGSGINGEVAKSRTIRRIGKKWAQAISPVAYNNTNYHNLTRAIIPAIGAVKIVYVSGYTTCPADVTQAVCFEVDMMRAIAGQGGQSTNSESLGEYSYSADISDKAGQLYGKFLSPATAIMLQPYLAQSVMGAI